MSPSSRREFLNDLGRGMLAAGLGATLARDLGFSAAFADDGAEALPLGDYEALVRLLQSTPADELQPILAAKLRKGETDLRTLVCAGALANAQTFGGCDYVGFHTAMALLPALEMSRASPPGREALPVLKVLYRNTQQIQSVGGASRKTLFALHAEEHAVEGDPGKRIRDACRETDVARAEELLAAAGDSPRAAFNAMQPAVQDDIDVHRFVFAHRTYGLAGLLGKEHAHTLLRQSVRLCVDHERGRIARKSGDPPVRALLPKLLDRYQLAGLEPGDRDPGDEAVEGLAETIYAGPPERAAEAAAAALAEGVSLEVVGEAISLASNALALRQGSDRWRTHGDAAGVHASDATNSWRDMARVIDARHAVSGLIVAAYHSAAHSPFATPAYPTDEPFDYPQFRWRG